MKTITLGTKVRDRVSGFEGIAIARCEYLNGCVQYCLRPPMGADGKFPEGQYIDAQQLDVVGDGIVVQQRETGGPSDHAPAPSYRG